MKSHRAQAQFERAKWKIAYLAPLWALQSFLSIVLLGLFSWRLAETVRRHKENEEDEEDLIITYVWEIVNVMMSLAMNICIVVEVARYVGESLTPWIMLFSNVAKATYATSILVLDVVVYAQHEDDRYSLVSLGIDIPLLISAVVMIIYAAVGHRRFSAYDEYSHPANVKGYGFNDGLNYYSDTSYNSRTPANRMSTDRTPRASLGSYSSRYSGDTTTSMSRGHRNSSGSSSSSTTHSQYQDQSPRSSSSPTLRALEPPTPPMMAQYTHERDTRFEEYRSLHGRNLPSESSTTTTAHWEAARTVGVAGRARGASTSKVKHASVEHQLLSVPEEEGDVPEVVTSGSAKAHRSTDSESSEVSASVPLMSGQEGTTNLRAAQR